MRLKTANEAFRANRYGAAMRAYLESLASRPGLANVLRQNIEMTRRKYLASVADGPLRVAVCGWSLTHNAAGRAHLLARLYGEFSQVELIGALFPKYGDGVWPPIAEGDIEPFVLRADDQRRFVQQAMALVAEHPCQVVHLSKPRMPNMLFGLLYKLIWGARVIVDVDDNELAFRRGGLKDEMDLDPATIGALPYPDRLAGPKWTDVAVKLVSLFDGVTVSNPVLQDWFGGTVIRHARCEREFDPGRFDRRAVRDKYGLPADRRIVLFLGTPRPHKGLVETAEALARLGRDDVSMLVVGGFDADARSVQRQMQAVSGVEIRFLEDQPLSAAPELVAAADVCLALQHPDSDVTRAQVPAKLSDALGMGRPALVVRNPAFTDLPLDDVALFTDLTDLDQVLDRALSDEWQNDEKRQQIRQVFLDEFSATVNARRLRQVVEALPEEDDPRLGRFARRILPHFPYFPEGLLGPQAAPKRQPEGEGIAARRLEEILGQDQPEGLDQALEESDRGIAEAERRLVEIGHKPLVSIVMPTHNRASIIAEAIQSVVEQSWAHWELFVCDDASTDATAEVVAQFDDPRIQYLKLEKQGAAAVRNRGLELARGEFIAYLDSDNMWRPGYLARMLWALIECPGRSCAYADFLDYRVDRQGGIKVKSYQRPAFDHERLLDKNYIDLNSFLHRRELYDCFGGFTESLPRRQDYDLIIKYTWLRDPLHVTDIVTLYQRNESLEQLTVTAKHQNPLVERIVDANVAGYLSDGLPQASAPAVQRVTVISWDMSRNHFSKAFAVAEALSRDYDVQLVSFRFFEEEIFPPLAGVKPPFETVYLPGGELPDFFDAMRRALARISGDVIYVVKPRLPSLGLALLARHVYGTPIVLEINDLESVVQAPGRDSADAALPLDKARPDDPELDNPYSHRWSLLMEWAGQQLPVLATHNRNIDAHFGHRCLYMRNPKDERVYDPARWDRNAIRRELRFSRSDRVILFGGLIRKHKGIYELIELVERLGDPRYKLLFVGSRISPDQKRLVAEYGNRITVLPPQDREAMARINLAADLVVLWLDPEVPASHYQMPYKATDAFAMGASVIANDISDLGDLARQSYLRLAPFGDWGAIEKAIHRVFADRKQRRAMQEAGQRLFRRQFSYAAMRSGFELASRRALAENDGQEEVAESFYDFFANFYRQRCLVDEDFALPGNVAGELAGAISTPEVRELDEPETLAGLEEDGVVALLPARHRGRGLAAARRLVARAGHPLKVLMVPVASEAEAVEAVRMAFSTLPCRQLLVVGEGILTGVDWLQKALAVSAAGDSCVLGLNGGQAPGEHSSCVLVRREWLKGLEDGVPEAKDPRGWMHAVQQRAAQKGVLAQVPEAVVYDLAAAEAELAGFEPEQPDYAPAVGWFERVRAGLGRVLGLGRRKAGSESGGEGGTAHEIPDIGSGRFRDDSAELGGPDGSSGRFRDDSAELGGADGSSGRFWGDITVIDGEQLRGLERGDEGHVTVIMPSINRRRALATARHLAHRAGMPVRIVVVLDNKRRGFVDTLNRSARRIRARYVVYLAEDAVAGQDWLKTAHRQLEDSGKGLLAFNCGKWHGRIAAFGMVRTAWVRGLYPKDILYSGYRAHRADNELTAIARANDEFVYCAEALLMENDPGKLVLDLGVEQSGKDDRRLFRQRYAKEFGGLAPADRLAEMADEYINRVGTLNAPQNAADRTLSGGKPILAEDQVDQTNKCGPQDAP
ncbi:glycosyltransferase [Wenzhouxiangella sp. EGI_FJ10305]|uniref:glycosyltransferase n=1 Tax=Wenzhouxiangella sp. EGI_FJ10305 TaxID=3243768 RepID=UPI0035DD617F